MNAARTRRLLRAIACATLLSASATTRARSAELGEFARALRVVTTASYAVSLAHDHPSIVAGQTIALRVAAHALSGDRTVALAAEVVPSVDGASESLRLDLAPDGRNAGAGAFVFPSVGTWDIDVDVTSAKVRPERAVFTVTVAAPNALPAPVAWAIALLPLFGLAAFARAEALRLRRLPSDEPALRDVRLARG